MRYLRINLSGILFSLFIVFCFNSCHNPNSQQRIQSNFYFKQLNINGIQIIVKHQDTILQNGIYEILIPDFVYAYGSNKNVIIAKNHEPIHERPWIIDTLKTNFYIIDIRGKNEVVHGPFWEYEFEKKLMEINGSMLKFEYQFSRLKK